MRENIQRKNFEEPKPPIEEQELTFETFNQTIGSANEPNYLIPDETIVVDDVLSEIKLTRADFDEEAVILRKIAQGTSAKNPTPDAVGRNILANMPNKMNSTEYDTETIVVDDVLSKRLSRADFTPAAIEKARLKNNNYISAEEKFNPTIPDHQLIEKNLRVGGSEKSNLSVPDYQPHNTKLTRKDFPGTGSAVMPELVFKKNFPAAPKKSFLGRLVPKFISKFFSK